MVPTTRGGGRRGSVCRGGKVSRRANTSRSRLFLAGFAKNKRGPENHNQLTGAADSRPVSCPHREPAPLFHVGCQPYGVTQGVTLMLVPGGITPCRGIEPGGTTVTLLPPWLETQFENEVVLKD
jgi:hypothetical protein